MDTISYKLVTITKDHYCSGCLRVFHKGDKMFSWACVDGGDFNHGYTCGTCNSIMELERESEYEEGFVSNNLNIGQTPEQYLEELQSYHEKRKSLKQQS